ncbi:septum formation initiator family protein [Halanaerobiaceae bacterium Z-7014]|uniref:Septum formation initiator family protein n=1 Tax=Halonatronomonas betaini TaxID=2778430 RepID=A0A931FA29_9FIRM|nr:septum formation initiator family protein [Halonatronomonas betaini]MBF8438193.1 septum formation initiator family protein [Halonatronomonas betaini]
MIKNQSIFKMAIPLFLIILLIIFTYQIIGNQRQINQLESNIERVESEIDETQELNLQLERELSLVDNPDYIERLAREKLGLVKPGEELIIPVKENE